MNSLQVMNGTQEMQTARLGYEVFDKFVAYLDAKPKTVDTYTAALKQFFRYMAEHNIQAPQFEDVKSYRDHLLATCKPTTTQAYIFAVRKFFQFTADQGIYPNVAGRLKGCKLDKSPKKDHLTQQQVKTVMSEIDQTTEQGKRNFAMIGLMVTCGLRDIEVARANVEDIRTTGGNRVIYVQGKGRDEKAEYVIVPPEVEKAITAYLKARGNTDGKQPLFTSTSNNSKGKGMTTRSISQVAKTAMVQAGYDSDRLTAHSLRHTAVTLALLGNHSDMRQTQQFARHSHSDTTEIYAHDLERANNRCSRIIANMIF